MSTKTITLSRHAKRHEPDHPEDGAALTTLLSQLAYAGKVLARETGRAALTGKLGLSGDKNITGDAQKKLDLVGNETVLEALADTGLIAAAVSEEVKEAELLASGPEARYILCVDPLDGSSNTDINGPVGTIFGIYRRTAAGQSVITSDLLRKGLEQVAAGYVMYGPSAVLVYTCGHGVNGFTLDEDLGEFVLSHEGIRCPARGNYYSANLGYYQAWDPNIQKFVQYITEQEPGSRRPYSLRYSGALVADVHRILLEGGLYFYPPDAKNKSGKLRLLYECAPLAFVAAQAGGHGSTGSQPILEIQAESLHQRVPLVIGSAGDVELYENFLRSGTPIAERR